MSTETSVSEGTSMPQKTMPLKPNLPKIVEISIPDSDWTLSFYEEYSSLLIDSTNQLNLFVHKKLSRYLDASFKDFRLQMTFKSVPFLVGLFYSEKKVRIYTPRLGSELFLIQEMEKQIRNNENFEYDQELFEDLKLHTEKVASLDFDSFPSVIQRVTHLGDLPDLLEDETYRGIEKYSYNIIDELMVHLNNYKPTFFEKISDWGLALTAQYSLLRIHLLKFLAILPSLDYDKHGTEVKRILLESLRRLISDSKKAARLNKKGQERALPARYLYNIKLAQTVASFLPPTFLTKVVRKTVRFMAKRFIAGETIEKAEFALKQLYKSKRDVTLDQLGELVVSEKEADNYCEEVIKLIRGFSLHVGKGDRNGAGINRAHVSIKVSALCSDFKAQAPDYTYKLVAPRLKKILLAAKEEDVFINIDAEHYDYRDIVFKVYKRVLLETPELHDFKATGIVVQAYLRDAYQHLQEVAELGKERGITMPIRLVKGAYWDAETVAANAHNYDAPEFLNKEETDLHFRQLIIKTFELYPHIQLCLASHNFSDHCFAETLRDTMYSYTPVVEHQCLHMTYEALSTAMAKMNWVVRNYVPVGSLLVGMAYLVRRIMENSSQVGVLTIMRSHKKKRSLKSASEIHLEKVKSGNIERDLTQFRLIDGFFNIPPVRLYLDDERIWVDQALKEFRQVHLGAEYLNKETLHGEMKEIFSPSDPSVLVGRIQHGNREDTQRVIAKLDEAYNSGKWAKLPWIVRSQALIRAANLMLTKRNELAALIVCEAGKAIAEALADVDEAIDFLNFYAREERRIHRHNQAIVSRGVIGVISPWNFPLAIPCGMVVSALVAGNHVILKSADQTPLIAQKLVDILHEAGIPKDVLVHIPGRGSEVGDELVSHERIAGIIFTGSKQVGMMIYHKASRRVYKNHLHQLSYPVKVITEMGGKNAIIVTANAELDETVAGILYSSFAHSGQKCSAASRVIVDNKVKERLIERLKEAATDIEVGEADRFSTFLNPVITGKEKERLQNEVKAAAKEAEENGGRIIVDRTQENLPGHCIGPAIIELPYEQAQKEESYAQRELFGPVVHIIGVHGLAQAIKLFNSTEYALTGGAFSQSQDDIDYLSKQLQSGNIYINRTITGARVAIEPFGGFKLSGTGPKAGGRGYINAFHINPTYDEVYPTASEEGSSYQFDLCSSSRLGPLARLRRFERALEFIIRHFEALYQGVYGENKDTLLKFKKWAQKNMIEFKTRHHNNRKIPGQLSYNDYSLLGEYAIVVSQTERPHFNTLMQTFAAIGMGVGVTVLARNQKAYDWWLTVRAFFVQSGISKENFDVFFSTEELLHKTLKDPMLSYVIFDTSIDQFERLGGELFSSQMNEKRVKSLLTPFDSADPSDFKRLCEQYVWIRSFAVNTMRHGAPMNLELL